MNRGEFESVLLCRANAVHERDMKEQAFSFDDPGEKRTLCRRGGIVGCWLNMHVAYAGG